MTRLCVSALALLALAAPAVAQSWPPPAGVDPHRYQADQHRYEIDRLRARADQREALARQFQLETRLNRLELEARRPAPVQPPADRLLRSPEEERALREAAADRRRATTAGVTQIDAWLDRPAD